MLSAWTCRYMFGCREDGCTIGGKFILLFIIIIKLYFQAHMQTITNAQRTHSIALHSWAI